MTSPRPLALFGAGGHAREVAQIVHDINAAEPRWRLLGAVVDAGHPDVTQGADPRLAILGDRRWLAAHPEVALVVAVGASLQRKRVVGELRARHPSLRFATLVHPRAWVAAGSEPGEGSVIFAGALVNVDARIGAHAILNLGCSVSHDCCIGDFASLGPGVRLPGGVIVGEAADLGAGSSARPGARVGARVVLGAGSVVVGELRDGCVAAGVPARSLDA